MGAIPQVKDRPSLQEDETLLLCDCCSFNGFEDEGDFIEIHNLLLCCKCYKIYNYTCTICYKLFYHERELCRVDDLACKTCCEDACGSDCDHIPKEVILDH